MENKNKQKKHSLSNDNSTFKNKKKS